MIDQKILDEAKKKHVKELTAKDIDEIFAHLKKMMEKESAAIDAKAFDEYKH
jgi:hypothetical protein